MHVDDGLNDVPEVFYGLTQGKRGDFVEIIEESAAVHVLNHQVNIVLFLEEAVKLDDVGVVEAGVQPNLSAKLIDHLVLYDLTLYYLLDGCHEASIVVPAEEDLSELPLAEVGS